LGASRAHTTVMAPSSKNQAPPYTKDEKVLCFHGDLMYEAKIIEVRPGTKVDDAQYRIHYKGWKASWDDWVSGDRIRKFTDDNKQLAAQLQAQARIRVQGSGASKGAALAGRNKGIAKAAGGGGATGSEISSARGSEERGPGNSSFGGRGPRRGRDYELENVSLFFPCIPLCLNLLFLSVRDAIWDLEASVIFLRDRRL
jgi:mortality factor 4-like protein 1